MGRFAANEEGEVRGREEGKDRNGKAEERKMEGERKKPLELNFYLLTYLLLTYMLVYLHTYLMVYLLTYLFTLFYVFCTFVFSCAAYVA